MKKIFSMTQKQIIEWLKAVSLLTDDFLANPEFDKPVAIMDFTKEISVILIGDIRQQLKNIRNNPLGALKYAQAHHRFINFNNKNSMFP